MEELKQIRSVLATEIMDALDMDGAQMRERLRQDMARRVRKVVSLDGIASYRVHQDRFTSQEMPSSPIQFVSQLKDHDAR